MSLAVGQEEDTATANADASTYKSETRLVNMMPKELEIRRIFELIKAHDFDLDTDIVPSRDSKGIFVVLGAPSTGKTSVIHRLLGCDPLVSKAGLGTR